MNNLTKNQKQWLAWIVIALVITLISTFLGVTYPIPEPPPFVADEVVKLGTTHFTNVEAEDITATDDLTVTDDASVGGDLTTTGLGTFSNDLTLANDFYISAQTAFSITAEGGVITPTGTYQPLEAAADYSSTLCASGFTTGTLLVLVNTVDHRLGITDTDTAKLSGNLFLDQYDSALLWFDGTNWIQLAETDN